MVVVARVGKAWAMSVIRSAEGARTSGIAQAVPTRPPRRRDIRIVEIQ